MVMRRVVVVAAIVAVAAFPLGFSAATYTSPALACGATPGFCPNPPDANPDTGDIRREAFSAPVDDTSDLTREAYPHWSDPGDWA